MITVKQNKVEEEITNSSLLIVCYFWSSHCPACRMTDPLLLELENSYKDKIKILKIDGESELKLVKTFSVDTVPTFILFKDLKIKQTIKGFNNKFDLERAIRTFI